MQKRIVIMMVNPRNKSKLKSGLYNIFSLIQLHVYHISTIDNTFGHFIYLLEV